MTDQNSHLLEVRDLKTYRFTFEGIARAVNGISYHLDKGEALGIVGESGCGKSVTASSIMRIIPEPPGKIVGGQISFKGEDLTQLSQKAMRRIRGSRIAMIFQEPMTSLNPVFTIGNQIAEMFTLHRGMNKKNAFEASIEMLERVQIPAPHKRIKDYPHQLSGGMRQRVMIAMALACNPEVLIADEPTTALDVTIQAQVLRLIGDLKRELGTAVVLITHDLGVVAEVCDRVLVMYAGQVVEEADIDDIFHAPSHPYTRALLRSIPKRGKRVPGAKFETIEGLVPDLKNLPTGCRFQGRCDVEQERCRKEEPPLIKLGERQTSRCFYAEEVRASSDANKAAPTSESNEDKS